MHERVLHVSFVRLLGKLDIHPFVYQQLLYTYAFTYIITRNIYTHTACFISEYLFIQSNT